MLERSRRKFHRFVYLENNYSFVVIHHTNRRTGRITETAYVVILQVRRVSVDGLSPHDGWWVWLVLEDPRHPFLQWLDRGEIAVGSGSWHGNTVSSWLMRNKATSFKCELSLIKPRRHRGRSWIVQANEERTDGRSSPSVYLETNTITG